MCVEYGANYDTVSGFLHCVCSKYNVVCDCNGFSNAWMLFTNVGKTIENGSSDYGSTTYNNGCRYMLGTCLFQYCSPSFKYWVTIKIFLTRVEGYGILLKTL